MVDKIHIMIVDDHPLFRQGLRRVIERERDLEVVREVADGQEALELAQELAPDVILMDINLPTMNGLQVTRRLKNNQLDTAVIILTAYHDDDQQFQAMKTGANAYYSKDVLPDELIKAIRQVDGGSIIFGDTVLDEPEAATWLLKQFEQQAAVPNSSEQTFVPLSAREMEILQQIARGLSNKEIGHILGISRQTVKNHMTSILRKLAVNDRTQAAIYALRRGWIRLQDTGD
jgi:DNA-binding NarL/FixJ family response regulator